MLAAAIALVPGCGEESDDSRFPCGAGSCELETEVCIIGGDNMCSTCVRAPEPYQLDPSCDSLPDANSPVYGDLACVDVGTCSESAGGAVLTCEEIEWGCG